MRLGALPSGGGSALTALAAAGGVIVNERGRARQLAAIGGEAVVAEVIAHAAEATVSTPDPFDLQTLEQEYALLHHAFNERIESLRPSADAPAGQQPLRRN